MESVRFPNTETNIYMFSEGETAVVKKLLLVVQWHKVDMMKTEQPLAEQHFVLMAWLT